jgi:hypothetical protein
VTTNIEPLFDIRHIFRDQTEVSGTTDKPVADIPVVGDDRRIQMTIHHHDLEDVDRTVLLVVTCRNIPILNDSIIAATVERASDRHGPMLPTLTPTNSPSAEEASK